MRKNVKLTYAEILEAAISGVMRQVENLKDQKRNAHGAKNNNAWDLHINGCIGERAVAKCLNLYWPGKGDFRGLDVGGVQTGFDVRQSRHSNGHLIVHKEDEDDRFIYFITGEFGEYVVHGGMKAGDAKQEKWWTEKANNGRPAYFVPQDCLIWPGDES